MKNTLAKEWMEFRKKVIPSNAPAIQVNEMQLAFYGGMQTMLLLMINKAAADDKNEEEGMAMLDMWQTEIAEFVRTKVGKNA